jgi:hypothetical protein
LPARRRLITAIHPWMTKLSSLTLYDVAGFQGQANGAANIKKVVASLASTLQHLDLTYRFSFDPPSLADFDMSSMPALVCFSYKGPWWITEDMIPLELCRNLFSRNYEELSLRFGWEARYYDVSTSSIQVFREALNLACFENRTPKILNFHLDISDEQHYNYEGAHKMEKELRSVLEILLDHGIDVNWYVEIPDPPSDLED